MKKLIAAIFFLNVISNNISAQTWSTTGNAGTTPGTNFIGTTDAKDFVFKTNATERGRVKSNGLWQFGATTNLAKIDSGGNLSFAGNAAYKVAGNKYAFQYSGNPNYGLFFNSTGLLFEFRTSTALSVFSVGANTGNGIFKGNLKIGAYTLPATDGTSGQVLQTNGTGTVTWQTPSSGGSITVGAIGSPTANGASITAGVLNLAGANASNGGVITTSAQTLGAGAKSFTNDLTVNGITVGKGIGSNTYNTAVGFESLLANTTGNDNTALGYSTLTSNTTGIENTANGFAALYANTTGGQNSAFGSLALTTNINGGANTAIGFSALKYNTSGNLNTAIGTEALFLNTTGSWNIAIGSMALHTNASGGSNIAIGWESMFSNYTGHSNTAYGQDALYYNNIGYENSATGNYSAYHNTNGIANTASGYEALYNNSTGDNNTSIGAFSLHSTLASSRNTAVGYSAGNGYDNSDFNTFIGSYTSTDVDYIYNSTVIGDGAVATGDNSVRIGDGGITSIGGQVGWTTLSDGRFKKNVKEDVAGLDFINQLRPVTYTVDVHGLNNFLRIPDSVCNKPGVDEKEKIIYSGFIAQEVEASAKKIGYDFSGVDAPKNENDYYGLRYGDFVVPVVKSIQELSTENDLLKTENAEQKLQIEDLNSKLDAVMNKMNSFENSLSQCCSSYQGSGSTNSFHLGEGKDGASLEQNVPNPFNQSSFIKYFAPSISKQIEIVVSDMNGRVIKTFSNLNNGFGTVNISAGTFAAGTYQYSLFIDGNKIDTKEMVIVK